MTFKENKPIYLQIADRIMDEILQEVYDYLQTQGIIYNKRGLGYFVATGAAQKIIELRKATFLQQVLPDVFKEMYLLHIPMETLSELFENYKKERMKSQE